MTAKSPLSKKVVNYTDTEKIELLHAPFMQKSKQSVLRAQKPPQDIYDDGVSSTASNRHTLIAAGITEATYNRKNYVYFQYLIGHRTLSLLFSSTRSFKLTIVFRSSYNSDIYNRSRITHSF